MQKGTGLPVPSRSNALAGRSRWPYFGQLPIDPYRQGLVPATGQRMHFEIRMVSVQGIPTVGTWQT